jgi:hypothetical protein
MAYKEAPACDLATSFCPLVSVGVWRYVDYVRYRGPLAMVYLRLTLDKGIRRREWGWRGEARDAVGRGVGAVASGTMGERGPEAERGGGAQAPLTSQAM